MNRKIILGPLFFLFGTIIATAGYVPIPAKVPAIEREFRGAWVAVVYNIDWPSKPGLTAKSQRAELRAIMDRASRIGLNAIIFQVRPAGDAVFPSKLEPWTHWLTGRAGESPGYDPLAYAIQLAHERGIELHAWFNPFRAQANLKHPLGRGHSALKRKSWIKKFGQSLWFDPSSPAARAQALRVILDVTRRYDIDGVHLDDYFYPYPKVVNGNSVQDFPDQAEYRRYRSAGGMLEHKDWRRSHVNDFIRQLYRQIKAVKPWVRVGISPFGIWRPGVPRGIEAGLDSYDHLFADSRLWLKEGWCDYLAPQLYWRDQGPQSFSKLLSWWRSQSRGRPVWPGIATSRINSKEDPKRPASEIVRQIQLSRKIGSSRDGHLHWSMKALMQNKGKINSLLEQSYPEPALAPPMSWMRGRVPTKPAFSAKRIANGTHLTLAATKGGTGARKHVIQIRTKGRWITYKIHQGPLKTLKIRIQPDAIALRAVSGFGAISPPSVLEFQ